MIYASVNYVTVYIGYSSNCFSTHPTYILCTFL